VCGHPTDEHFFTDVSGELVRENVVENEPGVPLTYEVQVIDMKTCEPLAGVMLEMWHCNSTVCGTL
jgi:protocatechuate 3,4-dioxygenase beta subunit